MNNWAKMNVSSWLLDLAQFGSHKRLKRVNLGGFALVSSLGLKGRKDHQKGRIAPNLGRCQHQTVMYQSHAHPAWQDTPIPRNVTESTRSCVNRRPSFIFHPSIAISNHIQDPFTPVLPNPPQLEWNLALALTPGLLLLSHSFILQHLPAWMVQSQRLKVQKIIISVWISR